MTPGASAVARQNANFDTDQLSYPNPTNGRSLVSGLVRTARKLWANKVAAELAVRTGMSVRTAERWLAGDRSMSGDAVVALLQSDKGVEFLNALIADMTPRAKRQWHREFEKAGQRADLRRRQAALDEQAEELE